MSPHTAVQLAVQVVAYGTCFASMWYTARKSLWGPTWGVLGCIPWVTMALQSGLWSMVAFEVVMTILEARMLWHWLKDHRALQLTA